MHLALLDGQFLGIQWSAWKVVGWLGNALFCSRWVVQWYATEKRKSVVLPVAFWWLTLCGSLLMLAYSLFYKKDSVYIFSFAFTWVPAVRSLLIHRRSVNLLECPSCSALSSASANYCSSCGAAMRARDPVAAP